MRKLINSFFKMNMVSMGASMISAVVALGALAYAFTLEARILTNDARSLSTCEAVSFSFLLNHIPCFEFECNIFKYFFHYFFPAQYNHK